MASTPTIADWMIHPFSGAVGAIMLSAAVRALPEPGTSGSNPFSALYGWFFRFANGVLANFDRAIPASRLPLVPAAESPHSPQEPFPLAAAFSGIGRMSIKD